MGMSPSTGPTAIPADLPLNGEWQFTYEPEPRGVSPTWALGPEGGFAGRLEPDGQPPALPQESAFTASITVPGYWDDQLDRFKTAQWWQEARFNPNYRPISFPFPPQDVAGGSPPNVSPRYLLGVGWYRRALDVPGDWRESMLTLRVKGAILDCFIYVNRRFVGYHLGYPAPLEVDLTPHLRLGATNELTIAVSNLHPTVGGCEFFGYGGYSGGLCRNVSLHVSGPGRIRDLFLRPVEFGSSGNAGRVRWWAEIRASHGPRSHATQLSWKICDPGGDILASGIVPVRGLDAGEVYIAEWETSAEGLKPWSCWEPQLCVAEVNWESGTEVWDRREQAFGMRSLVGDGKRLRLNGRPVMLRGVCDHSYFAPYANPPASVDYYRHLIRSIQGVGHNFIRCHTWVPPEEYMRAADELGMLMQVELPLGLGLDGWRDVVRFCRRHPSVAIYCGGNEQHCNEKLISFFEQMYAAAKELDPGCLVMPQETLRGVEHFWGSQDMDFPQDELAREPFAHHAARLERIQKCSDVLGPYAWGRLSYESLRGDWRELERRFAVYRRPILAHELGITECYLDPSLEDRYTERIPPDLYRSARENLTAAGRWYMAETYYRNSARWQTILRKHMFETVRRCDSVAGFDHLGGWHSHWHRTGYGCGTLNEFFELKHGDTIQALLESNGESVVLLDSDYNLKRSFWAGESYAGNVMVSLYGGRRLSEGVMRWQLRAGEAVLLEGETQGIGAPDGRLTTVGRVEFEWPGLDRASKTTLHVTVMGAGYSLTNQWDYWVFPRQAAPRCAAAASVEAASILGVRYGDMAPVGLCSNVPLRIVQRLDAGETDHLAAGGDVLLLGSEPFPARPTSFQIACSGRVGYGALATVIADHPVFTGLPHDGYCDWQFHPLLDGGRCVVFNELRTRFDPILEVVSSYKDLRWQAAMWEAQVGAGRLFVASFHFDESDPAAAAMLDGIVKYVTGSSFVPRSCMSLDSVKTLLDGHDHLVGTGNPDADYDPNRAR